MHSFNSNDGFYNSQNYNQYPNQQASDYSQPQQQFNNYQQPGVYQQNQPNGHYNPSMLGNPMMTDLAMKMGTDALDKGTGFVKEGLSNFVSKSKFKYYFAVNNSYVSKKLMLLLFPYAHRDWGSKYEKNGPIPPVYDINAVDLYIPFMSLITYVLVSAFVLGSQSRFDPEQLGIQTTQGLIWMFIEIVVLYLSLYLLNIKSNISYLDLVAFSGYKFFSMIIILLSFLGFGKTGFYVSFIWTCLALSFFLIRTLKHAVLSQPEQDSTLNTYPGYQQMSLGKRHAYFLLIAALAQPFIIYIMTSRVIFGYLIFS